MASGTRWRRSRCRSQRSCAGTASRRAPYPNHVPALAPPLPAAFLQHRRRPASRDPRWQRVARVLLGPRRVAAMLPLTAVSARAQIWYPNAKLQLEPVMNVARSNNRWEGFKARAWPHPRTARPLSHALRIPADGLVGTCREGGCTSRPSGCRSTAAHAAPSMNTHTQHPPHACLAVHCPHHMQCRMERVLWPGRPWWTS